MKQKNETNRELETTSHSYSFWVCNIGYMVCEVGKASLQNPGIKLFVYI